MSDVLTVEEHFLNKEPHVRPLYEWLLISVRELGDVQEAPKKTSIHLDHHKSFAGVYTRQSYINVRFRLDHPIQDSRILKVEKLSKRRYLMTVKLEDLDEIDDQLMGWLKEAYELSA